MKRSQNVVLPEMRKNWRQFSLAPIYVAVTTAMISGCSDDSVRTNIYGTIDECIYDHPSYAAECKSAYQDALEEASRTAPKYKSIDDCAHEFGFSGCVAAPQNNWFMPAMAGFMFARMVDDRRYYSQPMFTSTYSRSIFYDDWITADGRTYGKSYQRGTVSVSRDEFKPKPTVKRTISRGGFGSTVSAKSSWSSSKSSSKGWGG